MPSGATSLAGTADVRATGRIPKGTTGGESSPQDVVNSSCTSRKLCANWARCASFTFFMAFFFVESSRGVIHCPSTMTRLAPPSVFTIALTSSMTVCPPREEMLFFPDQTRWRLSAIMRWWADTKVPFFVGAPFFGSQ